LSDPNNRAVPQSNSVWRVIYADAIAENNPEKLWEKVAAAEAAIFERLQELTQDADSGDERSDLRLATKTLLALKTDTLKYPPWRQE
jgi:hypothetical protein